LEELIVFCTNSPVENPLEREGTPIQVNQKLIATKLLEPIIGLLIASFQLENFKLSKLVYRLIKQVCKGNAKCSILFNDFAEILSHPPQQVIIGNSQGLFVDLDGSDSYTYRNLP
jgi:hypothetical protein